MMGRRTAAMLCVLFLHALFLVALEVDRAVSRSARREAAAPAMTLMEIAQPSPDDDLPILSTPDLVSADAPRMPPADEPAAAAPSAAITPRPPVDWPIEARLSAARVLEQEREAERLARLFAGPQGTWASLTKRQRSQLNKFKWAPGVEGLKYDDKGNAIYTLPSGCTIVNL